MGLVCFASFKGSPGVTLTALATAAAWPTAGGRRKLLLEADADGGALALRYQLPTKPGLLSLAASARRGLAPEQLWDHAQLLPGGLPVVLAPDGPEQVTELLRATGRELGEWLKTVPDVDVIADVGRLSLSSASLELARSADAVLAVARPTAVQLQPSAQRMLSLAANGPKVGWILIGEKPYSATDVTNAYGLPVVHVVEDDQRGARLLESGASPGKLRRSTLIRSIRGLAEVLAEWLHPAHGESSSPPRPSPVADDTMPPSGSAGSQHGQRRSPPPGDTEGRAPAPDGAESLAVLAARRDKAGSHPDNAAVGLPEPAVDGSEP